MRTISLTKGQVALVDDCDFDYLVQFSWAAVWKPKTKSFYAVRNEIIDGRKTVTYMHREILGLKHGDSRMGDHVASGETLNNARSNLRIASHAENCRNSRRPTTNTSGYKGVSPANGNAWQANIWTSGKQVYLGVRKTPEEAHALYCEAAARLRGEFARTN
jgi:hypothetical protein